jgi:hypothetical protein
MFLEHFTHIGQSTCRMIADRVECDICIAMSFAAAVLKLVKNELDS